MHSTQSVSLRSFVYGHFQPIPLTKYLNFFSHSQLEWLTHIQSKYWKWINMQILNGFWLVLDVSIRTPFTHPNTEKPLSNCRNWISNGNNNSCPLAILCQWCLCFYLFSGVFLLHLDKWKHLFALHSLENVIISVCHYETACRVFFAFLSHLIYRKNTLRIIK